MLIQSSPSDSVDFPRRRFQKAGGGWVGIFFHVTQIIPKHILLSISPVDAPAYTHREGDFEGEGILHLFFDQALYLTALFFRDLENQLIVDLEDHL